jgi:protein ImuA
MAAAIQLAATALSSRLRRQVWQGDQLAEPDARAISSGYVVLDRLLPGQGWPTGALTELLVEYGGVGEMRLLAHVLQGLTVQAGRSVMLVSPPYRPYVSALKRWGWPSTGSSGCARARIRPSGPPSRR